MSQSLSGRKTDTNKLFTDNIVITEILFYFLKKGKWTEEG
jgi:hypothetical protein